MPILTVILKQVVNPTEDSQFTYIPWVCEFLCLRYTRVLHWNGHTYTRI